MLYVVGIGPGNYENMTIRAEKAIQESDMIVGYTKYLSLLKPYFPEKEFFGTGMTGEIARCREAIAFAKQGKTVSVVCSGDSGIYGMASLIYELAEKEDQSIEIQVIPGITAALSGSALLGAPLAHDTAIISLSDLMTPKSFIWERVRCAAKGDFCIAIYNPSSKKRGTYLQEACKILLEYRSKNTPCGFAKRIGREGEEVHFCTLEELQFAEVDMETTVFIGNSQSRFGEKTLITPRGYIEKYETPKAQIVLFGGTVEGRKLADFFAKAKLSVAVYVATEYGEDVLRKEKENPYLQVHVGRLTEEEIKEILIKTKPKYVVDATHPYAIEVTKNIETAAKEAQVPYQRVLREKNETEEGIYVDSVKDAALLLRDRKDLQPVFLLTGSKEADVFAGVFESLENLYVRIIPGKENLEKMSHIGLEMSHVVAMQGPFSQAMNEVMFQHFGVKTIVTKESGEKGGFYEKINAAKSLGVTSIIVRRPVEETGLPFMEVANKIMQEVQKED